MMQDVLAALVSLVIAVLVVGPLAGQLKKHPWVFYLVAVVVAAAYLCYAYAATFNPVVQVCVECVRKGYIASFFLATVMYIGALPETSRIRKHLHPVRAELSILSFILYLAHILSYLPSYLPRLGALVTSGNVVGVSLLLAIVLAVVYLVLSLLSFKVVRVKMPYRVWKGIQRLSYLMVVLLLAHIWLVLGRSALAGGSAVVGLVVYTVVIVVYAVLRIRRAVLARRTRAERKAAGEAAEEGK